MVMMHSHSFLSPRKYNTLILSVVITLRFQGENTTSHGYKESFSNIHRAQLQYICTVLIDGGKKIEQITLVKIIAWSANQTTVLPKHRLSSPWLFLLWAVAAANVLDFKDGCTLPLNAHWNIYFKSLRLKHVLCNCNGVKGRVSSLHG